MKKITVVLLLVALFATGCDSLWLHETEKPVTISFTIPQEWLQEFEAHNRSVQGDKNLALRSGVDTSITATASIYDAKNGEVLAEHTVNIGNDLDETISIGPLSIVGKTVYAQVELKQLGYESRIEKTNTFEVKAGSNRVEFEFDEAEYASYLLSFDPNGGIVAPTSKEVTYLQPIGDLPVPEKSGDTFSGWQIEDTIITESTEWSFVENKTAIALWNVTIYEVDFESNEGSAVAAQRIEHGENVTEPADPTRVGYTFAGWYEDAGLSDLWDFDTDTVTANMTLNAKWTVREYTLTFNAADGSGADAPRDVTYGQAIGAITEPTRTGYTFDGWDIGGITITGATIWNYTSDQTATAVWVANNYTVTFNTNDGSAVNPEDVTYNNSATEPAEPTRSGFVFAGWYEDSSFETEYDFTTPVTADITLYAWWQTRMNATLSGNVLTVSQTNDPSGTTFKAAIHAEVNDSNRANITEINIVQPEGGAKIIPEVDLSSLFGDGHLVDGNYNNVFYENLTAITGLEYLDVSNVTNISYMIFNAASLTSFNMSGWNTSNVTDMGTLFASCGGLTTIIGIENLDTSNVTNMEALMQSCYSLESLDLSGWNTSNVINMNYLLSSCDNLTELNLSGWNTSSVSFYSDMFGITTTLNSVTVSNTLTENIANQLSPKSGEVNGIYYSTPGKWVPAANLDAEGTDNIPVSGGNAVAGTYKAKVRFTPTMVKATISGTTVTIAPSTDSDATTFKAALHAAVPDPNNFGITQITIVPPNDSSKIFPEENLYQLFRYYNGETFTITGLEHLDTSNVTNMIGMFQHSSIRTLDLSSWNTENVTNMNSMFWDSSIETLNLSGWNLEKVTSLGEVFGYCRSLTSLDLTGWDTSNIEGYNNMIVDVTLDTVTLSNTLTENIANLILPKSGEVNGVYYSNPGKWVKDGVEYSTIPIVDGKAVAGTYTAKREP